MRPKMATITLSLPRSGLRSSMLPWKFTNGPSMTRTLSPFWKVDLSLGFSAPSSICFRIPSTSSAGRATGFAPDPTKPVTFGVERTRCQVSSVSSISTRRYPGKNFCSVSIFLLFRISRTFSVGTITRPKLSWRLKIFARDSMADATLFSNPKMVWTTNHCFVDVVVSLICPVPPSRDLAPSQHPIHDPGEPHVHRGEKHREDHHHRQHHRGGVDDLGPVRPGDPAELAQHLAKELLDALEELHVLSFRRLDCALTAANWQAWRDSNPHPPDLESGALAVRATRLRI